MQVMEIKAVASIEELRLAIRRRSTGFSSRSSMAGKVGTRCWVHTSRCWPPSAGAEGIPEAGGEEKSAGGSNNRRDMESTERVPNRQVPGCRMEGGTLPVRGTGRVPRQRFCPCVSLCCRDGPWTSSRTPFVGDLPSEVGPSFEGSLRWRAGATMAGGGCKGASGSEQRGAEASEGVPKEGAPGCRKKGGPRPVRGTGEHQVVVLRPHLRPYSCLESRTGLRLSPLHGCTILKPS
ncbi:uncharacterized protein LOC120516417 [Polypterus senegalus]|uniref:uncharacterized protein LOC120516417 n=1 Tax=Polypterus senegalus TaxID=55291 RepID=UPI0019625B01|nr:uncharacterized protein LOC120516417 [Polypterus senegalus]